MTATVYGNIKQASHLQLPLCNQGSSLWLSQWLTFKSAVLNPPPRCASFSYGITLSGRKWCRKGKDEEGGVGLEDFSPSTQPLFVALLLHSLVLTLQSSTEEGFKERLVEVRQGWAWKRRIVRSHSSQMQAGAKSVAGGITPMNHAHCDAYPGWEHGKELGMAEPYQLPFRYRSATRCMRPGQPFPSLLIHSIHEYGIPPLPCVVT